MKFLPALSFRNVLFTAGLLLAAALPATAQNNTSFNLSFDDLINDAGTTPYNDNNLFVTFQAEDANITFGNTTGNISFSGNFITGTNMVTSPAYSLATIAQDGGFVVNSATSLIGYISYGNNSLGDATAAPSPFTTPYRYSNFELTYNPGPGNTSSGGADLTDIVQFGGALGMSTSANGTFQAYVANTAPDGGSTTSGALFQKLAATPTGGLTGGLASQAIMTTTGLASGNFVRVLGPDLFPLGTNTTIPYQSFNNYLGALSLAHGNSSVGQLQNLQPGFLPGQNGSIGMSNITGNYNADYYFNATVVPAGNGTYGVLLQGNIEMSPALDPPGTNITTYSNLSIMLTADAPGSLSMTQFIYQQTPSGLPVSPSYNGWGNFSSDFGGGNSTTIQLKVMGDFSEGMLTGMLGSNTEFAPANSTVGNMTSTQWWANGTIAYDFAQPSNPYYNLYSEVIAENSAGNTTSAGNFTSNAVYGNPFDDRFDQNLITLNGSTTNMTITIEPDGDVSVAPVPEPAVDALLASSAALLSAAIIRRRSRLHAERSAAGETDEISDRS